ncbi:undecaprenyl/decaprenyl-phosphate alpha-N-acetylglucosaminyl 1-phosphate transferase [Candidatus Falkowbacteria bacterium]|nr:undecaprenyl/decaprenyl-phosphate alpha-N-acetylglucosaminyl 1-phosphate transferase [Candidatus Falkowbacteria bacterium]
MFLVAFLISTFFSLIATLVVRKVAVAFSILDTPKNDRKIHMKPTPLLGGLGIFVAFCLSIVTVSYISHRLNFDSMSVFDLLGVMMGGLVLVVGGVLDDIYDLPPTRQIIFPIIATLITIALGVSASSITNPFGGTLYFGGVIGALITFAWLMGMMYTTKYLDGIDGLVSGLVVVASSIMFFVSLDITLKQEYIAVLALVIAGIFCGFWFFNFNPASIFLGESGSLLAGYLIGVLAILSGTKIATALLVFGIPILDVVWVITRRLKSRASIFKGDKMHLHHRLLAVGFSSRQVALLMYAVCLLFGSTSLFLQTQYKLYVLMLLVLFMIALAFGLIFQYNKSHDKKIHHS